MSTKKHHIPDELVTQLLGDYQKPEDLIGENGLLKQLTKLLVEKAFEAVMAEHLGHDKHESDANLGEISLIFTPLPSVPDAMLPINKPHQLYASIVRVSN